jgi:hypothetical protein
MRPVAKCRWVVGPIFEASRAYSETFGPAREALELNRFVPLRPNPVIDPDAGHYPDPIVFEGLTLPRGKADHWSYPNSELVANRGRPTASFPQIVIFVSVPLGLNHVDACRTADDVVNVAWPNAIEVVHDYELRPKLVELLPNRFLCSCADEPTACEVRFVVRVSPQPERGCDDEQARRHCRPVGKGQTDSEGRNREEPGGKQPDAHASARSLP